MKRNTESFEEVKRRLDEIVDAVADDDLPLDDALKLYEEAVQLGLRVSRRFWRRISRRTTRSMMKSAHEDVQDAGEEAPNASEPSTQA